MTIECISTTDAIRPWVSRAVLDLYVSSQLVEEVDFGLHLFFLQQAVEKLSKAYLIACHAHRFSKQEYQKAVEWFEDFAKKQLGRNHNLEPLLDLIAIGEPRILAYARDKNLMDALNGAYEEGRYPTAPQRMESRHPAYTIDSKMSNDHRDKTIQLVHLIMEMISSRLDTRWTIEEFKPHKIKQSNWQRFINRTK